MNLITKWGIYACIPLLWLLDEPWSTREILTGISYRVAITFVGFWYFFYQDEDNKRLWRDFKREFSKFREINKLITQQKKFLISSHQFLGDKQFEARDTLENPNAKLELFFVRDKVVIYNADEFLLVNKDYENIKKYLRNCKYNKPIHYYNSDIIDKAIKGNIHREVELGALLL